MGQNSPEDLNRSINGEDFFNAAIDAKVRYIRFNVLKTWAGGDNFQITEIQVFGDNRKK